MLSFSQLEFSLAPSVVEKPPGRDSVLEALARATSSSSRAQPLWPRRFVLNGRLVFAPPPAARNTVLDAFYSTAVSALTAQLKSTGLSAMSWRTCSRNFAPAAAASRRMGSSGVGPVSIWGLAAKRVVTICHSLCGASGAVTSTPAPVASATFHAPAHFEVPPPASPVVGPSTAVAMTAASSSGSSSIRRGVAFR